MGRNRLASAHASHDWTVFQQEVPTQQPSARKAAVELTMRNTE